MAETTSQKPGPPGSGSRDSLVGRVVAERYRVLELVARGGMGRIYRAIQEPLGREIALKILTRPLLGTDHDDSALEKRFLLEAATCARLVHPNTVTVFDYGALELDGSPTFYMAMEFVRGRTLAQVLRADGPMPAARAASVAYEIARSLREAHAAGVVHRDLKPSNVMIVETDEGESVKVLDFGVAKVLAHGTEALTTDGAFVGSPRYTAPEQIRQEGVDGRSDLYALGVVMWEMVCGGPPFSSPEPMRTLLMHLNDPLPTFAPQVPVPAPLETLIRRLLEKSPESRPADADTLVHILRPFRGRDEGDSVTDLPLDPELVTQPTGLLPAPPDRHVGGVPRFLLALAAAALALLVSLVAFGGMAWWWSRAEVSARPAEEGPLPDSVAQPPLQVTTPPVNLPLGEGPDSVRVESDPAGAEVWFGGKKQGETPMALSYDAASAARAPLAFELRRAGYRAAELTISGRDADGVLVGTLTRRAVDVKKPDKPPVAGPDDIRLER
ncbi:hypothetical protein LBMAG42_14050 [Deltaproteobacteria bacterium]|nr:hypothetical protein LBMAG42_14050 [Deltaproteobacteria bacterium]